MSSRKLKHLAQDNLVDCMMRAFGEVVNGSAMHIGDKDLLDEMEKQARRVEKLFGFEPGSWAR